MDRVALSAGFVAVCNANPAVVHLDRHFAQSIAKARTGNATPVREFETRPVHRAHQ